MRLAAVRQTVDDLQVDLAVQTLDLHANDLYCSMSAHACIIGERTFTLQGVGCG